MIRPDPDHHTLYHLFFNHHANKGQQIEGLKVTSPLQAAAAEARLAAQYNINISELAPLNATIAAISLKLDKIDAEAKALLDESHRSKTQPSQTKIDDLQARRYLVVMGGVAAVRRTLAPSSWSNIRSYINQQFRATTQVLH